MPRSPQTRWLVGWLCAGALAFTGCAADTSSPEGVGGLVIELELANGVEIDEVTYAIGGPDMDPMIGTIDTSAPGSTASVEVYGLPPGSGYEVLLTADSTDGLTMCSGSAPFIITAGMRTEVGVMLNCKPPQELGGVRVNGKINFCADLIKATAAPLTTSVGNDIALTSEAVDREGDPIEYLWTATGGSIADPSAQDTTYTCLEVGEQTITITVSDDGFEYCDCDHTFDVTCVDGMGGTGGAGGVGGVGGMGGDVGVGGSGGDVGMGGSGGDVGMGGSGGDVGMGGSGGDVGMGGSGGDVGVGGSGGDVGMGGMGGDVGMGGSGGEIGMGGMGGEIGMGGMGGMAGTGGTGGTGGGICIPDGGAQWAGDPVSRTCGETSCGAMEVCVEGVCEAAGLVFLTNDQFDGDLGGPRGADATCARLAMTAGLGGYWMSWTSDRCTSPFKRFEKSTIPYRMLDGTQISSSWSRMTMDPPPSGQGYLDNPIDINEFGTPIGPGFFGCDNSILPAYGCSAWTNTEVDGRVDQDNGCRGLSTNEGTANGTDALQAAIGKTFSIAQGWTNGQFLACSFDTPHIYCFEQSEADPDPSLP